MKHTYTNLWFNSSAGDTREGKEGRRAMSCCRRRLQYVPSLLCGLMNKIFEFCQGALKGTTKHQSPPQITGLMPSRKAEFSIKPQNLKKKIKIFEFLQKTLIFQISEFKLKFCAGHPPSNHVPLLGFLIAAPHSIGVTPPLTGQILGPPLVSRYTM